MVALRAQADKIILGGMGLSNDDFLFFKNVFENAGALDRIISFVNTTEQPPVERLLVPDMALTAAEYLQLRKGKSTRSAYRYDPLRRCIKYCIEPYGSNPVKGFNAWFLVFGFG